MGKTLSKEPCKLCGSNDNLVTFLTDSGRTVTRCMTPNCSNKGSSGILDSRIENSNDIEETPRTGTNKELLVGLYQNIPERGLKGETCRIYKYQVLDNMHIMNYPGGDQKIRISPTPEGEKKKIFWQQNSTKQGFFGQEIEILHKKDVDVVVCEGELDAQSIYEATRGQSRGYHAISLRDGCGHLLEELEQNKEWLLGFRSVIVCMDNDEAGNLALKKAIDCCSFKFRICKMPPDTDPNDLHCRGLDDDLVGYIRDADYIRPKGLVLGSELDFDKIMEDEKPGILTGMPMFDEITGGLYESSLIVLGGGTAAGKSALLRQKFVYELMQFRPGIKILNLFLEENQRMTVKAFVAIDNQIPYHKLKTNKNLITKEQYALSQLRFVTENLAFLDSGFELNSKKLFDMLEYVCYYKQYDLVILDHISMVAGTSNVSRNGERRDIDDLMYKLVEIKNKSKTIIVAAVHLTDPERGGKKFEEGRVVTMSDFRGSGAIKQTADVCLGLVRDTMTEGNQTKSQLYVLKNRISARVGKADEFYYMENTGILTTNPLGRI